MFAREPVRGDWRRLHVFCENKETTKVVPSKITSVEHRTMFWGEMSREYTADEWKRIGTALGESQLLRKLNLSYLNKESIEALFAGGRNWPLLEHLELSGKIGITGTKSIIQIITPLSNLDTLDLSYAKLGNIAARSLAKALDCIKINNLFIAGNNIKDQGLEEILSARNAKYLIGLNVKSNELGDQAFKELSMFLRRDDICLKKLFFSTCNHHHRHPSYASDYSKREDRLKMLVQSIKGASKLELISLEHFESVYDYLVNLLCATSDVASVENSNHRLCAFGVNCDGDYSEFYEEGDHSQLTKLIEINKQVREGGSVANAIRRKLRNVYFEKPYFNVQRFMRMDVALMPYLIELVQFVDCKESREQWWSRHKSGRQPRLELRETVDRLYHLLRNCHPSELFSFPSHESLMREKDKKIHELEIKAVDLKAENEEMAKRLHLLQQENDKLRHNMCPVPPNKRAKTDNGAKMNSIESRVAVLEADVAMLKKSQTTAQNKK